MTVEPANAKINLALHVRARRDDGYHELETLFAFVELGDRIELRPSAKSQLTLSGDFARQMAAAPGPNLINAAIARFHAVFGGTSACVVTLDKKIPIAAGLGGGSADAAATLRALARLEGIAEDDPRLFACAQAIGSDVPACLLNKTAIGRGRGELLEPVPGMPGKPVLLVNPGVAVSTAEVFRRWDGVDHGPLGKDPLAGRNDLEAPARSVAPVIGEVLERLAAQAGVTLARMSGSGATCFALFETDTARDAAAAAVRAARPDWWCAPTRLI